MRTTLHPLQTQLTILFLRCKQKWHDLQLKIQRLFAPLSHDEATPWPPLNELTLAPMEAPNKEEGTTMAAAHWPLDDKHASVEPHSMVVVEVKYFPNDPYTTLHRQQQTENEDPNLRITHYPPSNRLH